MQQDAGRPPTYDGGMSSERDQLVQEIAKFPGHLTIAAACLMMNLEGVAEVVEVDLGSIEDFNDSIAPVTRNGQRLEQVIRFVGDLDVGGLRDLRDLTRDLVTELFRTVH
jgi:hypothetical protein